MPEPGPSLKNAAADDLTVTADAQKQADRHGESTERDDAKRPAKAAPRPREIGGAEGPEPTRYGDWERKGRCIDF